MTHEVRMLGTGNAFLPHLRYHSFLVFDGKHIIDAPPTALLSLRRAGISPADIETIFITHLHGDHVFGLPFLLLEKKYISDREGHILSQLLVQAGFENVSVNFAVLHFQVVLMMPLIMFDLLRPNQEQLMGGIGNVFESIMMTQLIPSDFASSMTMAAHSYTQGIQGHVRI